jgi:hypothetical protein
MRFVGKGRALSYRSNAKQTALRISDSFSSGNVAIKEPIFDFDTVWMWSKLMTQSLCNPICFDKNTSLGISLIVEVIGATVTWFR